MFFSCLQAQLIVINHISIKILLAQLHFFGLEFAYHGQEESMVFCGCNIDKRVPDLVVKRSHVSEMTWHRWPIDKALSEL